MFRRLWLEGLSWIVGSLLTVAVFFINFSCVNFSLARHPERNEVEREGLIPAAKGDSAFDDENERRLRRFLTVLLRVTYTKKGQPCGCPFFVNFEMPDFLTF